MKRLCLFLVLFLWLGATCRGQPESPVRIQEIRRPGPISLNKANPILETPFVSIGEMSADFTLRLRRPTSTNSVKWDSTAKVKVTLEISLDAEIFKCTGQASGGIRINKFGEEIDAYELQYGLPVVADNDTVKRIGETRNNLFARIRLELIEGDSVETDLVLATIQEKARPNIKVHHSVAFTTASTVGEEAGDGTVSVSVTATGSNTAAFAGSCHGASSSKTSTATYGGSGMTELFDQNIVTPPFSWNSGTAGYSLAGVATSAQTVTNVLNNSTGLETQGMIVITVSGAHQTTTIGTPQTNSDNSGTATSLSVTVTDLDGDGLLVDVIGGEEITSGMTQGANQDERADFQTSSVVRMGASTQDPDDGGVMSWTFPEADFGISMGAVEFKPASAAAGGTSRSGQVIQVVR